MRIRAARFHAGLFESWPDHSSCAPPRFSFAILSPQVDFVDLGTSFGVDVGASGTTQLHVFEGEVLCSQPKKPTSGRGVIHVLANKAMEFTTSTGPPSNIAINEEQFARLIALRRAADFDGRPFG